MESTPTPNDPPARPMDRFQVVNAAWKVDGYIGASPFFSEEELFKRAKKEAVFALKSAIADIDALTIEQFQYTKGKHFC